MTYEFGKALHELCGNPYNKELIHYNGNWSIRSCGVTFGNPQKGLGLRGVIVLQKVKEHSKEDGNIVSTEILRQILERNQRKVSLRITGNPMSEVSCAVVLAYTGKIEDIWIPECAIRSANRLILCQTFDKEKGRKLYTLIAEFLPVENKIEAIRTLQNLPAWGVEFTEKGELLWKKVNPKVIKGAHERMEKGTKLTLQRKTISMLIMQIAKLNPGTILRLSASNGILPCMSICLGKRKPEALVLPEGVKRVGRVITATCTGREDIPAVSILEIEM